LAKALSKNSLRRRLAGGIRRYKTLALLPTAIEIKELLFNFKIIEKQLSRLKLKIKMI
jgi:hypothetical protein